MLPSVKGGAILPVRLDGRVPAATESRGGLMYSYLIRGRDAEFLKMMKALTEKPPKVCPCCGGKGVVLMEGDLHRSSGMVPCTYQDETGVCGRDGVWIPKKGK